MAARSSTIFLAVVFLSFTGCGTRWARMNDPIMNPMPAYVRVTTNSGRQIVLYYPYVEDQKLVGLKQLPYDSVTPKTVRVPLASIASTEYGELRPGEKVAMGTGIGIGVATLSVLALLMVLALGGGWGYD